jgi:hypothetical protein
VAQPLAVAMNAEEEKATVAGLTVLIEQWCHRESAGRRAGPAAIEGDTDPSRCR